MNAIKVLRGLAAAIYATLWLGGIGAYVLWGGPPAGLEWTAPAFLALAAFLVVSDAHASDAVVFVLAGIIGFLAEVLGTRTGFPFGEYHYTSALGPNLLNVPLVMIAAWLVLFAYVRQMSRLRIIGALWLTAIDALIDPLAAHPLGFWRWQRGDAYYGIPWTNFVGWFLVSILLFGCLPKTRPTSAAMSVGLSVVAFFTANAWALGYRGPGCVGLSLMALHLAQRLRATRQSA